MNPKALKSLEYYKIIDQLTEKASSQMGKDLCRHLLPSEDVYEIRHMQTQTRDALTRLFQKGNISFGSVKDVRGSLKRLEIGSSLGISELLAIAGLLENIENIEKIHYDRLKKLIIKLEDKAAANNDGTYNWVCSTCGAVFVQKDEPEYCPLCLKEEVFFYKQPNK